MPQYRGIKFFSFSSGHVGIEPNIDGEADTARISISQTHSKALRSQCLPTIPKRLRRPGVHYPGALKKIKKNLFPRHRRVNAVILICDVKT